MARFTDLPGELIVMITQFVYPDDFDNLRQVCKRIKLHTDSHVSEHQRLRRLYTSYMNRGLWNTSQHDSGSLARLLKDIVLTPSHATYIKNLSLYHWHTHEQVARERQNDTQEFLNKDLALQVNQELGYLSKEEFKEWVREVKQGVETPIVGILLMLLPCLSILHLTRIDSYADWLIHAVIHIAGNPSSGVLSQLTTVTVSFRDNRAAFCLITAFAALPSVKTIHAEYLGTGDEYNLKQAERIMPLSSNVTELSLRNAAIPTPLLLKLVGCCRALKAFEYSGPSAGHLPHRGLSSGCGQYWETHGRPPSAGS